MVWEDLKPSDILSEASFENAITADMAIGGSTNAIIHLVALAGRAGIKLDLKRFDEASQRTPMIANHALLRWARARLFVSRAVCYQDSVDAALPDELKDANPLNIWRMVDGKMTRA